MIQIAHITASDIVAYEQCPKLYYWNHHRDPSGYPERRALGSFLHRQARLLMDPEGPYARRSTAEWLDDSLKEAGPKFADEERALAVHCLRRFADAQGAQRDAVDSVERLLWTVLPDGLILSGRIDRLDRDATRPGQFELIDYKLEGGRVPSIGQVARTPTLLIYQLLALRSAIPIARVGIYDFVHGIAVWAPPAHRRLRVMQHGVEEIARAIAAGGFSPAPSGFCVACPHLYKCAEGQRQAAAA
jgi:RecB family exonuclease